MVAVHGGEAGHVHYHPMPPCVCSILFLLWIRQPWMMHGGHGWMVLHVPIFSTEHKLSQHDPINRFCLLVLRPVFPVTSLAHQYYYLLLVFQAKTHMLTPSMASFVLAPLNCSSFFSNSSVAQSMVFQRLSNLLLPEECSQRSFKREVQVQQSSSRIQDQAVDFKSKSKGLCCFRLNCSPK